MALLRWRRDVEPILDDLSAVRFWDMAATKPLKPSDDPDWTAGVLLAVTRGQQPGSARGRWIICHVMRFRETPAKTDELMFERHLVDDELIGRPIPVRAELEGGSSGIRDMDHVARDTFLGVDFEAKRPVGSKTDRAKPFSRAAQAHHVDVVEGDWNQDYLDEFELFPDGLHDDQVDASSGAMKWLAQLLESSGARAETVGQTNTWGAVR